MNANLHQYSISTKDPTAKEILKIILILIRVLFKNMYSYMYVHMHDIYVTRMRTSEGITSKKILP